MYSLFILSTCFCNSISNYHGGCRRLQDLHPGFKMNHARQHVTLNLFVTLYFHLPIRQQEAQKQGYPLPVI